MLSLEFFVIAAILVYGFVYLAITYPMGVAGIVAFYGACYVWCDISHKREQAKRIRVALDVEKRYSEMSELQRRRIVNAVMDGASIDDFTLEDGWLKRGHGVKARYAKPTGKWGYKENYLDTHPLYAEENHILQKDFAKFNLSDAETHELCSLMYFNWVIIGMDESQEQLLVSLTRRGEHVFKRYSRLTVKHAE